MSAYSRSSQKLVFTSLIHYSQGLICITKENVSSSLICRNRLILTNTHKLIHKRISICYFATINLTKILKLAHHSSEIGIRTKISYLKWSLLTANVTWVLSPTRGTLLLFILESAQQRFIPSTAGNECSASVYVWDFPFLMLPWLSTSSVQSFPDRFKQFHLHVVD